MKIIIVGKTLENYLFAIINISKEFGYKLVYCKETIPNSVGNRDVFVIDSDLIKQIPSESENLIFTIPSSPTYLASLKNEKIIHTSSIASIAVELKKIAERFFYIAVDEKSKTAFQIADKIAKTNASVLITGETGTGKEVLARYIHMQSDRSENNYVTLNCAAIPEALLESELFGHEKGAFTNAINRRIGKFEVAHNGTILLDEIGDMPLSLQAKLLRVLQEMEISPIGSNKKIIIDTRVIAITNKNLAQCVIDGTFREDLFYRLNVIPIYVPKLTDRPLDIEPLASFFCKKYSRDQKKLSANMLHHIKTRSWPGNIRELENFIHREVLFSNDDLVDYEHQINNSNKTLKQIEQDVIINAIQKFNGNKKLISEELGIPIRTLRNKIKSLQS